MNVLCRLLLLVILASFPVAVSAQESGQGMLCDTRKQIEDFATLANESRNPQASLEKVNDGGSVCAILPVIFVRHETVASVRTPEGLCDIVRVTVLGIGTPFGVQAVPPLEQFILVKTLGQGI